MCTAWYSALCVILPVAMLAHSLTVVYVCQWCCPTDDVYSAFAGDGGVCGRGPTLSGDLRSLYKDGTHVYCMLGVFAMPRGDAMSLAQLNQIRASISSHPNRPKTEHSPHALPCPAVRPWHGLRTNPLASQRVARADGNLLGEPPRRTLLCIPTEH